MSEDKEKKPIPTAETPITENKPHSSPEEKGAPTSPEVKVTPASDAEKTIEDNKKTNETKPAPTVSSSPEGSVSPSTEASGDKNAKEKEGTSGEANADNLSIKEALHQQQEQSRKEKEKRRILWRKNTSVRRRKQSEFKFKLIDVKRVTKVTKGGRRFRFFAVALAGDQKGQIGVGFGKANEVGGARIKAFAHAEKNLFKVPIVNESIPHEVFSKFCSSQILLKPAPPGSGVIVGGAARSVVELLGIKNIRGKSLGSNNKMNVIQATIKCLKQLKTAEEIRELRGDHEKKALPAN